MTCTSELDVDKPIRRRFSSFAGPTAPVPLQVFATDETRATPRGPLPPAAAAIVVVCGGL